MKKRLFAVVLLIALMLTLVGCSADETNLELDIKKLEIDPVFFEPAGNGFRKKFEIVYSASANFKDLKTVKAAEDSSGKFKLTINNFKAGTNYYYKSYTKDDCNNIIYSAATKIKTSGGSDNKIADALLIVKTEDFSSVSVALAVISVAFVIIIILGTKKKIDN